MQVLQVQLEIRPDPAEVGRARRWARSRLAGLGIEADEPLAETLILLVSELVTNAVVHTGRPAVLRLSLPGGAVRPDTAAPDPADGRADGPAAGAAPDTPLPDAPGIQGTRAAWEASGAPGTPGAPVVRDGRDTRNGIPAAPGDRGTPEPVAAAATTASAAAAASSAATATVRLEVADTSSRAPVPRCAGGEATGGRGLALVDCLADRWGWSPEGAGKSIWCELDRCPGGREGAETAYGSGTAAFEGLAFEAV